MKKLFLMLSFAGATAFVMAQTTTTPTTTAPAQNVAATPDPNAPIIKWDDDKTTIDYGTVTKSDEANAKREFKFTNKGQSPLIISSCRGSCGCTVPTCPTEAIIPGGKGSISVHYDVNRVGPFTKTVTVTSNAKNPNETLKIQGTVNDPNAGKEPAPTNGTIAPAPANGTVAPPNAH